MKTIRRAAACGLGFLMLALGLQAQTVQGVVTGTVFDPTGAVLPRAEITLTNVATNIEQKQIASSDGSFRFNLVPPGVYNLSVKAPGFREKQITELRVEPSQTTPVNIGLSVASDNHQRASGGLREPGADGQRGIGYHRQSRIHHPDTPALAQHF